MKCKIIALCIQICELIKYIFYTVIIYIHDNKQTKYEAS
jgi:hypothetical protein